MWQNYEVALQGKIEAGVIRDDAQEHISGIIAIGLQAIFFKETFFINKTIAFFLVVEGPRKNPHRLFEVHRQKAGQHYSLRLPPKQVVGNLQCSYKGFPHPHSDSRCLHLQSRHLHLKHCNDCQSCPLY